MRTVRRLYFYAVAFISLEVVLWGLINLSRTTFAIETVTSLADQLAQALSLVLVGVPVFTLHWVLAQRSAHKDEDEHTSAIRAVFLYGVLFATLTPIVQNVWALLNRSLFQLFDMSINLAILGGEQSLADNLIAIIMNGGVAAYFITIVRREWQTLTDTEMLSDVRRLYRYLWVLYGLGLVVTGVYQALSFLFYLPGSDIGTSSRTWLVNSLALLLVGTPLWVWTWRIVQGSLTDISESGSNLRLGVLYLLALGSVITVLVSAGLVLDLILRLILGESISFGEIMNELSNPLAVGIPFAGIWAYYGGWFKRSVDSLPEAGRRAGANRLYFYVLALVGLAASFIGVSMLVSFALDMAFDQATWLGSLRSDLAASLATLFAGLPLWLLTWRPMQTEALTANDMGDHARRSVVRKAYLYLVLFAAVIGGMTSAGAGLYQVLNALLGESRLDVLGDFMDAVQWFVLFMGLLAYHLYVLRRDGSQSAHALAVKHSQFPVLVFDNNGGTFGQAVELALRKQSPRLPVMVQAITAGVPQEQAFKAVILPADLALNPPEACRLWLREFNGSRLVVPFEAPGWVWVGKCGKESRAIEQAAQAARQLAEGQEIRFGAVSGWMILVYVLAAMMAFPIIMFLISLFVSAFVD